METIKYYWTDKQRSHILKMLYNLRGMTERGDTWFLNVENSRTKDLHEAGCRLIEKVIEKVETMRKITEEY